MKRTDMIRLLWKNGWKLKRSCGGHDVYEKGNDTVAIPRHRELNEILCKSIIRQKGLK